MKSLFSNILISSLFLISLASCATAQTTTGDQTITMKVYGLCEDCKLRIETAAMDTKGVKKAEWDKQSNTLVVIGSSKMTKEKVAEAVAKAGYKSEIMDADPKGYAKLPTCCQYVSDEEKH
jgi:copper chaperone CopZ